MSTVVLLHFRSTFLLLYVYWQHGTTNFRNVFNEIKSLFTPPKLFTQNCDSSQYAEEMLWKVYPLNDKIYSIITQKGAYAKNFSSNSHVKQYAQILSVRSKLQHMKTKEIALRMLPKQIFCQWNSISSDRWKIRYAFLSRSKISFFN